MKVSAAVSLVVCVAFVGIAPRFAVANAMAVFWIEMIALSALMIIVGQSVTKHFWGILVNERNVMSLSRFQAVLWTVLVLADYATILLGRAWQSQSLASMQDLRPDLLALMGISYASAVGASIVSANKSEKPTPATAVQSAQTNLGDTKGDFTAAQGVLYKNKDASDASIGDMFHGDELADVHTADLSKVQMFFFTVVSAVVFIGMADALFTIQPIGNVLIPRLPDSLIALMGISHLGYLGNKTVTRTTQQPAVAAQPQPQPGDEPNVVSGTKPTVAGTISG